jgi:hypothetical protein
MGVGRRVWTLKGLGTLAAFLPVLHSTQNTVRAMGMCLPRASTEEY